MGDRCRPPRAGHCSAAAGAAEARLESHRRLISAAVFPGGDHRMLAVVFRPSQDLPLFRRDRLKYRGPSRLRAQLAPHARADLDDHRRKASGVIGCVSYRWRCRHSPDRRSPNGPAVALKIIRARSFDFGLATCQSSRQTTLRVRTRELSRALCRRFVGPAGSPGSCACRPSSPSVIHPRNASSTPPIFFPLPS